VLTCSIQWLVEVEGFEPSRALASRAVPRVLRHPRNDAAARIAPGRRLRFQAVRR
jgi:hypothetical protein